LLNAITVSVHPTKPTIGEPPRPRYLLRAGLHRLEACKILGWQEIPAIITTLTGLRADLVEVDENLMQTTLTATQRAIFTAKRKAIYEALYPETAKGGLNKTSINIMPTFPSLQVIEPFAAFLNPNVVLQICRGMHRFGLESSMMYSCTSDVLYLGLSLLGYCVSLYSQSISSAKVRK
jgi:hypothetical protein